MTVEVFVISHVSGEVKIFAVMGKIDIGGKIFGSLIGGVVNRVDPFPAGNADYCHGTAGSGRQGTDGVVL